MTLSAIAALDCQPERPQEEPRVLVMADHLGQKSGTSGQTKTDERLRSNEKKHTIRTRKTRTNTRKTRTRTIVQIR